MLFNSNLIFVQYFSTCLDGSCILSAYVCDGTFDCPDKFDESSCDVFHTFVLPNDYYDGFNTWHNGGDVSFYSHNVFTSTTMPTQFDQYPNYNTTIPPSSNIPCPNGHSLCTYYRSECFLRHKRCIFERDIFGEPVHCSDTEHLTYCEHYQCPAMFKCANSYCIPLHMICDGINDCPDSEDESFCGELITKGLLRCRQVNIYVAPYNVCDNITHCVLSADDEMFCKDFICPGECYCRGYTVMCDNINLSDISHKLTPSVTLLYYTNSDRMIDLSKDFSNMKMLDLTNSSFQNGIVPSNYFNHLKGLRVLILTNTYITALHNAPFRDLKKVQYFKILQNSIPKISKMSFIGLGEIRTLDIHDIKLKHIGPDSFYDLKKLVTLNVSYNKLKHLTKNAFRIMKNTYKDKHLIVQEYNSLQHLDLRSNDIVDVDIDIFQAISIVILDHQDDPLGCFFTNQSQTTTKLRQMCRNILPSVPIVLVFWFAAMFIVLHTITSLWLQFTSLGFNPKFAVIADIFISDLIVVLQLLIALVSHSVFQHNYPFVVRKISKYFVCKAFATLMILTHLTPNQNWTLMAVLYHRVTVYAMVKQPYGFRQCVVIIAGMKVASIAVAAAWVYHVEEYNNFFCVPFMFPHTWSSSPNISVIASTLIITVNIILLTVTIVIYVSIAKHVAGKTMNLNKANTKKRTHILRKTLSIDILLQLCSVIIRSSLIILTSQDIAIYSILFVAHALCNAVINTIIYNRKHLPLLRQHVKGLYRKNVSMQERLNRNSKELQVVMKLRMKYAYAYACVSAQQQYARLKVSKVLPFLLITIIVAVMIYFSIDASI